MATLNAWQKSSRELKFGRQSEARIGKTPGRFRLVESRANQRYTDCSDIACLEPQSETTHLPMIETYKPSGKFGLLSLPLLGIGIALVVLLAFIYQFAIYWIPFIYINVLLTIGMGIAIGVISSLVVTYGRIRSVTIGCSIAIFLVLACLSAKFGFQYLQSINEYQDHIRETQALTPEQDAGLFQTVLTGYSFTDHINERTEEGWRIGRITAGFPITGPFVYLIWLIEAGIVVFCAWTGAHTAASVPYNESVNQWADEEDIVMTLPITNYKMVQQIRSATTVDELLSIPIPKTDESNRFAVYTVNSIPGQEMENAYLSVSQVVYTVDDKGEQQSDSTPIVTHAILSKAQRELLVENASIMQEAFDDYRESLEAEALEEDVPVIQTGEEPTA